MRNGNCSSPITRRPRRHSATLRPPSRRARDDASQVPSRECRISCPSNARTLRARSSIRRFPHNSRRRPHRSQPACTPPTWQPPRHVFALMPATRPPGYATHPAPYADAPQSRRRDPDRLIRSSWSLRHRSCRGIIAAISIPALCWHGVANYALSRCHEAPCPSPGGGAAHNGRHAQPSFLVDPPARRSTGLPSLEPRSRLGTRKRLRFRFVLPMRRRHRGRPDAAKRPSLPTGDRRRCPGLSSRRSRLRPRATPGQPRPRRGARRQGASRAQPFDRGGSPMGVAANPGATGIARSSSRSRPSAARVHTRRRVTPPSDAGPRAGQRPAVQSFAMTFPTPPTFRAPSTFMLPSQSSPRVPQRPRRGLYLDPASCCWSRGAVAAARGRRHRRGSSSFDRGRLAFHNAVHRPVPFGARWLGLSLQIFQVASLLAIPLVHHRLGR